MTFTNAGVLEESTAPIGRPGIGLEMGLPGTQMRIVQANPFEMYSYWRRYYDEALLAHPERTSILSASTKLSMGGPMLGDSNTHSLILTAQSILGLVSAARANHLSDVAEQIEEIADELEHDKDDSPFDKESVRCALMFLINHRKLPDPDVGVRRGGLVDFSWHIPPDGVLTVYFNSSGSLTFATNVPGRGNVERQRMSGTVTDPDVVACVFGKLLVAATVS